MVHEHQGIVLHKMLHDKMSKIYIFQALLMFVKSLVGIFVPVYLYSKGYSLEIVLFYSIMVSVVFILSIPPAIRIISRLGFRYSLLLSIPLYIIHLTSLSYIDAHPIFFNLTWLSFGIYAAIFWPAFHSEVAVNSSKSKRGSEIGTLEIITTIVGTLAPMIGGFTLEYFGYLELLFISTVLLFLSVIPLMFSRDVRLHKYEFGYKDFVRLTKDRKWKNSKIAFVCEGIEVGLSFLIWPILLFILLDNNFFILGSLLTFISFVSVLAIGYLKGYIDKHSKDRMLKTMTRFFSFGWFLRLVVLFLGSILLYFIETFAKLIRNIFMLPFMAIFYDNAKKGSYMDYIILREFYLHLAKIGFLLFFVAIISINDNDIMTLGAAVAVGIFASLGLSFLKEE